jgi:hypothetical protein
MMSGLPLDIKDRMLSATRSEFVPTVMKMRNRATSKKVGYVPRECIQNRMTKTILLGQRITFVDGDVKLSI